MDTYAIQNGNLGNPGKREGKEAESLFYGIPSKVSKEVASESFSPSGSKKWGHKKRTVSRLWLNEISSSPRRLSKATEGNLALPNSPQTRASEVERGEGEPERKLSNYLTRLLDANAAERR